MAKTEYMLGLKVANTSVGFAAVDRNYQIVRKHGKALWGVRLFDEAQTAEERRVARMARRSNYREKLRVKQLTDVFRDALDKADPDFLNRMKESWLWEEDKTTGSKNSLFADADFTDKDYHQQYPTIYHLRAELIRSKEPHDVRLVFLALLHCMKHRGHFFYDMSEDADTTTSCASQFDALCTELRDNYGVELVGVHRDEYIDILQKRNLRVTDKAKMLRENLVENNADADIDIAYLSDLLAGKSIALAKLFRDDTLKTADIKNVTLQSGLDEIYADLCDILDDRAEVLLAAQGAYDSAHLAQVLDGHEYVSDAKVARFEQNKKDLTLLKQYVREHYPQEFSHIFKERSTSKSPVANYVAYSKNHHKSGEYKCTQEDFCKFLKSTLPNMKTDAENNPDIARMSVQIDEGTFLPRLHSSENRVIPYQLHLAEVKAILTNAETYLPFLREKNEDGMTATEQLIKIFCFRIPYYGGPISPKATSCWAVRRPGMENVKVTPLNYDKVMDLHKTAENFISKLIGRCGYTGEPVLPKNSLLYSEFSLLNELNAIRINNEPLDVDVKKALVDDLFYRQSGKVTKAKITKYLKNKGVMKADDILTGIDVAVNADVSSLRDLASVREHLHNDEKVEAIIRSVVVFGGDRKMLTSWLNSNVPELTEMEKQRICKLKYDGWGTLSKMFLTEIYTPGDYGEAKSIIEMMRDTSLNLMQLLTSDYAFAENAKDYYDRTYGATKTLNEILEDMYVAPAARRGIHQALRVVEEIVRICGGLPKKLMVEMDRENREEMQKKRTTSRKDTLLKIYKEAKLPAEYKYLLKELQSESDSDLDSRKLYLYYAQLGRCAFTGAKLERDSLMKNSGYNLDHIYPQSRVRDNSGDNIVLVDISMNQNKSNKYPIDSRIQKNMRSFWNDLKRYGLMSEEKYMRLTRTSPLSGRELSAFIERDMTQTRQTTKALTMLLKKKYPNLRIVYSKAGNVADFRQWLNNDGLEYVKCEDINDLWRAKDAYLNVVVGNVYDEKFTKKFFLNIEKENYSLKRIFEYPVVNAWDVNTSRTIVLATLARNNILMTRMPVERKGVISDLMLCPAGKGQLERKNGMDINKYGGYNKRTATYFCCVEHTKGKKRIRSIQPVMLCYVTQYEKDPIAYCKEVLNLDDPVIIRKRILIDSLLEIDGKRLYLAGRSGNKLCLEHAYPLRLDDVDAQYVRNIGKYVDRCNALRRELPVNEYTGLTVADNIALYDTFRRKLEESVYAGMFNPLQRHLENNRDKFADMSILEQCKLLLEILKTFLCNPQKTNLKTLCGIGTVGAISKSNNLEEYESVYAIDTSVTGVYTDRVNLKE